MRRYVPFGLFIALLSLCLCPQVYASITWAQRCKLLLLRLAPRLLAEQTERYELRLNAKEKEVWEAAKALGSDARISWSDPKWQAIAAHFDTKETGANSIKYIVDVVRTHPFLITEAQGCNFFTGSHSGSLLFLFPEHRPKGPYALVPPKTLLDSGLAPFSGTFDLGYHLPNGVSNDGVNVYDLERFTKALDFSTRGMAFLTPMELREAEVLGTMNLGWTPEFGLAQLGVWKELGNPNLLQKSVLGPDPAVIRKRLEVWERLKPDQKEWVKEGFPVLYGLNEQQAEWFNIRGGDRHYVVPGGVPFSNIRVVFVPRKKVEQVRQVARQSPESAHIRISPIEPLLVISHRNPPTQIVFEE